MRVYRDQGFGSYIGETAQDVFDYLEDVLYEPIGVGVGVLTTVNYVELSFG